MYSIDKPCLMCTWQRFFFSIQQNVYTLVQELLKFYVMAFKIFYSISIFEFFS